MRCSLMIFNVYRAILKDKDCLVEIQMHKEEKKESAWSSDYSKNDVGSNPEDINLLVLSIKCFFSSLLCLQTNNAQK